MVLIGKQPASILPLQILNLLGHRRLREMQYLGGLSVIHVLAQPQEGVNPMVEHISRLLIISINYQ